MEFCQSGPGMAAEGDRTLVSLGEEDLTGRALTGATDGDRVRSNLPSVYSKSSGRTTTIESEVVMSCRI